jgi:hypothetical protein
MTPLLPVELLTRRDCGLCDRALAALRAVAADLPLHLQVRDIDADADTALLREFDWRVPVVRVDGRVVCEGLVTEAQLRTALHAEAGAP